MYMTDHMSRETKFHLEDYAGEHNKFADDLLHPMSHKLVINSVNGDTHSIALGQLELMLKYVERYPNMGKALDALFLGAENAPKR